MFKLFTAFGLSLVMTQITWAELPEAKIDSAIDSQTSEKPISATFLEPRNYGFGYWFNGFRKNADDSSPDLLCLQTGYYGLALDLGDLVNARFGTLQHPHYAAGLTSGTNLISELPPAELLIQVTGSGRVFTARKSLTGDSSNARRLEDTLLWESGRYLQHYDIQHLVFEDDEGNELSCKAILTVVGWPDSLTLSTEITPEQPLVDGPSLGVVGNGYTVAEASTTIDGSDVPDQDAFTLECWVRLPRNPAKPNNGWLLSKNGEKNDDGQLGFYFHNGRIEACMNIGGGHSNRHSLYDNNRHAFTFDDWHHLALSYDGATMKYYFNGRLANSKPVTGVRKPNLGAIHLGGSSEKSRQTAYGSFDQIRLWDRALSSQELQAHRKDPETTANQNGLSFEKTFDAPSAPKPTHYLWQNMISRIQLKTADGIWEARSPTIEQLEIGSTYRLALNCDLNPEKTPSEQVPITVHTSDGQTIASNFDEALNCQVAEIKRIKRDWRTGYTDIRDYDEFTIEINNPSNSRDEVPFMLYLRDVANITGHVPTLCYEDGTPTGIPVQLSKNWHELKLRSYLRAYTVLPTNAEKQIYKLRIPYGFYGTLPSASHAQLSLVGYGGNSRWDQLAIGCWGETICFDVDRSCVDVAVTDVRMLMARIGAEGKKWNWTNAGWGGDWLMVNNDAGNRHHPAELKTAYFSHGPCLTDVRYNGHFGSQREVDFEAEVQTLRTDDYARTFQKLRYTFDKVVSTKDAYLFRMGRTGSYATPRFAYGNSSGLIQELEVPNTLKRGDSMIEQLAISGAAPWWVSFPGAGQTRDDDKGNGYRALVIRDYRATLGGKLYTQPSISTPVYQANRDGSMNLDFLLTAPQGVDSFQPGDTVEMDLEWITLHREAGDYYGPNEPYREHLETNPSSWKTTYREAIGNHLNVQVNGGSVINNYPIQIQAESDTIAIRIKGGVGYVPIRFEGLASATGYTLYQVIDGKAIALDQSVHGNDFWQTDYDNTTGTFTRVYNLPLDGLQSSDWLLRKD